MTLVVLGICAVVGAIIGTSSGLRDRMGPWKLLACLGLLIEILLGPELIYISIHHGDSLIGRSAFCGFGGFLIGHVLGVLASCFRHPKKSSSPDQP